MKALSISVSLCLALAGCNMMAGLGEDMQQAGVNLQQRAAEAQQNRRRTMVRREYTTHDRL